MSAEKICICCEKKFKSSHSSRKYCDRCRGATAAERRRIRIKAGLPVDKPQKKAKREPDESALLNYHSLKGKSLARVDAEAKAFGLTYGQYTAAVYSGSIDRLLKLKGIDDPVAVLRGVKVK